jgi:hypothetical protein
MKKLLPHAKPMSVCLAMVFGLAMYLIVAAPLLPAIAQHAGSASAFVFGLVGISAATVFFGCVVFFLALAALVVAARGRSFIAYTRVSRCNSLAGWLCASWNFFGAGGQQEGVRFFGLEVALQGRL